MSAQNPRTCPICETAIPVSFPAGMCPKCLLNSAASSDKRNPKSADAPDSTHTGIPTLETLRRYFPDLEIIESLGTGGMGAVYKARQPRLARLVALKIMTYKPGHEVDFALRFEREAQVLARLTHPHIVIIYDFGELDETRTGGDPLFYFLMEYVDGTDLAQLIRAGEMKAPQALAIVPQICEALQYAHDQGITHRDIKPANILIDQRGTVKIADFGLAKMAHHHEPYLHTGLTQTGMALGTPHYMAPEQWENPDLVDHRADIYALGVVFYEMLTGERPAGVFEPPSKKSAVDKKLDGVVLRAMERNPDRRYQQASEIKSDVTRISGRQRQDPHNPTNKASPSGFKKIYGLGLGAIILTGSWLYFQGPLRQDSDQKLFSTRLATASTNTLRPGRLRAAGVTYGGQPHDLSKFAPYDDYIDVAGGWHQWVALRANGETLSSNGKSDLTGIRRIVRGLLETYAFINESNHLIVPTHLPISLPEPLLKTAIVDATFGRDHGILLTTEGTAIPYGKRYEETIGDWKDPTQWDTPRWPPPPGKALRDVIDIAVTATHAATLNHKGEVTLWGWDGVTTWAPEPNIKHVTNIESDDDTLWLLDEAGQVWSLYLPRSPSAHKVVFFDHKLKFAAANVVQQRQRFWCYKDGTWRSNRSEPNLNLSDLPLKPDGAFSVSSGAFNGKVLSSALWIEPEAQHPLVTPTFTAKPGKLTSLGSLRAGRPIDLRKAEGITDFTQVVLHDKGWVALRANGQTVSSDGRGERQNIVNICPGIDTVFTLIDTHNHVEVFARLESSEDLNTILPSDIQKIGVTNLLSDGQQSLALLKDGTARVWGNRYDNPSAVPEWMGREAWERPPTGALVNVKSIAITSLSASTVTADGRLWTWGKAASGELPENAAALQGQYASLVSSNSGLYDALAQDGRRISFNLSTREAQVGAPGIVASAYGGYRPLHQRAEGYWSTAWNRSEFQPYFDAIRRRPASTFSLMFFHEGDERVSVGLLKIDSIE
ncbi:Serine/threonine protein kinase [Prosthecobacter debontii]|uniref:Serine/threonine protein kinase n=2 Tax=Prosthecobacter debontii TaxID=48467 RepID=A0A1T4YFK8_9BACT|nr:Serine/threonine protein kinase [Prosthecobacter debontii]